MSNLQLIPSKVVRVLYEKTGVTYNPAVVWEVFNDLAAGAPCTKNRLEVLFDFFLSIGIIVMSKVYREVVRITPSGDIQHSEQVEELNELVDILLGYYTARPGQLVIAHFPSPPANNDERRLFHAHFMRIARLRRVDAWRRLNVDNLGRRMAQLNDMYPGGETGEQMREADYREAITTSDWWDEDDATGDMTLYLDRVMPDNEIMALFDREAGRVLTRRSGIELFRNALTKASRSQIDQIVGGLVKGLGLAQGPEISEPMRKARIVATGTGSIDKIRVGSTEPEANVEDNAEKGIAFAVVAYPGSDHTDMTIAQLASQAHRTAKDVGLEHVVGISLGAKTATDDEDDASVRQAWARYFAEQWSLVDVFNAIYTIYEKLPESEKTRLDEMLRAELGNFEDVA